MGLDSGSRPTNAVTAKKADAINHRDCAEADDETGKVKEFEDHKNIWC